MSDPEPEQRKGVRSEKSKRFWIEVSLVILFVLSAACILLQFFIIPKFEQIYRDALPGQVLPPLTQFIIMARIALGIVGLCWPILGIVLIRQQKRYAILWINIGIVWTFLQIGITVVALIMPMVGITTGGMGEGR